MHFLSLPFLPRNGLAKDVIRMKEIKPNFIADIRSALSLLFRAVVVFEDGTQMKDESQQFI